MSDGKIMNFPHCAILPWELVASVAYGRLRLIPVLCNVLKVFADTSNSDTNALANGGNMDFVTMINSLDTVSINMDSALCFFPSEYL